MGIVSEVVAGTAAILYTNAKLSRLIPNLRTGKTLAESLVRVAPAGRVLTLQGNFGGEVGWSSPLLLAEVAVDPTVTDHYRVNLPVRQGWKGGFRLFRPYAYIEKLNVGLEAARAKAYAKGMSFSDELLSVNYFASVSNTQALSRKICVFPMLAKDPMSVGLKLSNTEANIRVSTGGKLLGSQFGPIFLKTARGEVLTPQLNTEDGKWSGVRTNVMRDTIMVASMQKLKSSVFESEVLLSAAMDPKQVEAMFIASDDFFLLSVHSLEVEGRVRTFARSSFAEEVKSQLRDIHVRVTQTGKCTKITLCADQYTEETWSHPL